jgi:hypothetical protein
LRLDGSRWRILSQCQPLSLRIAIWNRSDFRQAGRNSCSIQRQQKPVEAVVSFEVEVSRSTKSVVEHKRPKMYKNRSIRSTGVTSNKTKVYVKTKVLSVVAAASLAMMVVGNHSA